jgi:hypothetical protein
MDYETEALKIVSIERYVLNLFYSEIQFSTYPHCQFRWIGQEMEKYLWYFFYFMRDRDRIIGRFTTTYVISAYHH